MASKEMSPEEAWARAHGGGAVDFDSLEKRVGQLAGAMNVVGTTTGRIEPDSYDTRVYGGARQGGKSNWERDAAAAGLLKLLPTIPKDDPTWEVLKQRLIAAGYGAKLDAELRSLMGTVTGRVPARDPSAVRDDRALSNRKVRKKVYFQPFKDFVIVRGAYASEDHMHEPAGNHPLQRVAALPSFWGQKS